MDDSDRASGSTLWYALRILMTIKKKSCNEIATSCNLLRVNTSGYSFCN